MRVLKFILTPCAILACTLSAAATPVTGQLSIGGYGEAVGSTGMGAATGIDFASGGGDTISGSSGGLYSFGAGSGSFAGLSCASASGGCGTIKDIASFASEPATSSFLTLATGGPIISFDLTNIESVVHATDPNGGSVTITADGTINFSGYDSTAGQFILTAQGNNIVSFSATELAALPTAPTPEPGSLVLLGAPMLFGAYRKLRRA